MWISSLRIGCCLVVAALCLGCDGNKDKDINKGKDRPTSAAEKKPA